MERMRIITASTKTKWKTKCNKCANVCSMFVYSYVCFVFLAKITCRSHYCIVQNILIFQNFRLIINYIFPRSFFTFFPTGALPFFSSVVREQAGLEENILRNYDPFRAEGDLIIFPPTRRTSADDFTAYLSFLHVLCFRCFGNLVLALTHYEKSAISDIFNKVSPVFSCVSSSFFSMDDQLRVTCASAGRTRS